MVAALALLPGILVVVPLAAWLLDGRGGRGERVVASVAQVVFGRFVGPHADRERIVRAAYLETTYSTYAAKSYLFALLAFVGGTIVGAYLVAGLLQVLEPLVGLLSGLPRTITSPLGIGPRFELVLDGGTWWVVVLGGGLVLGAVAGVGAYVFRWTIPASTAEVRRVNIDEGLPRSVAFMYALSRGGVGVPEIMTVLGQNRQVYGETAKEMRVASREMDVFGRDVITAIRQTGRRSPSERFKSFSENLASVMQSGSQLSAFFREQYDRFQKEAEDRQGELIELLATIAEAYVTVLVAGVLFLITILTVFGLTTTDTLTMLQVIAYVMIPTANVAFVLYLVRQLETLGMGQRSASAALEQYIPDTPVNPSTAPRARRGNSKGDQEEKRGRDTARQLRWYDRFRRVKDLVRSPVQAVLRNPTAILYLTVPIALLAFLLRLPDAFLAVGVNLRILDDLVVQSLLFVLGSYAIVHEIYTRRVKRIEAATPDMLERLASLNESGMSVVEGFDRLRGSDLGVLTPEVERIWRDIEYGSTVSDALVRFGRRVRTRSVSRVVVLLTNAMESSGEMGDVLRIAADQARNELDLRRQRRQQMLTYLLVIYVAFGVFMIIILAVKQVLVPSLPESVPTPAGGGMTQFGANTDQFSRIGSVNKAAYTLIFFHTAIIQAVASGFIAGLFGDGTLKDGAKHAAILLGIAYVTFVLLSSPVSSIAASEQIDGSSELTLDTVSVSEGGFVVVRDGSVNGTVLGQSEYLTPGAHRDVTIELDTTIHEGDTVYVVSHQDTNGNEVLDYRGPWTPSDPGVDRPYESLASGATPGVEVLITTP